VILLQTYTHASSAPSKGEWEGQLLSKRRPIIIYLNFERMIARLDVTGSQELQLRKVQEQDAKIQFSILVQDQELNFSGILSNEQIIGKENESQTDFVLKRLPELPAPRNRVERWSQDIDVMIDRFLKYDRSYTDEQRQEATKILRNLQSALNEKTDEEVIVELSRAVARTQNAHTRLYLLRNRTVLRRYPIRLWWMSDGLFVVKATEPYRDLLACKLIKIGAHTASDVRKQVAELFAGNEPWIDYKSTYYMTSPEILSGLRLITGAEKTEFTFQCGTETKLKSIIPLPLAYQNTPTESWWDLSPEWKTGQQVWIHSLADKKIPLYLQNPEQYYWFKLIQPQQVLYFQYNRSQNMQGESIIQFGERLRTSLNSESVKKLIVDLRFNTGGDLTIARSLMEDLNKNAAEKGISVFVLIGRSTFSAGISHAVQWKESGRATFIGEPCGDVLDFFSEGGNVILPNSKLAAHYANGFHTYSKTEYPEFQPYYLDMNVDNLQPDRKIQLSSTAYFAGKDPVLEAVFHGIPESN
jgi:hypothetical protein